MIQSKKKKRDAEVSQPAQKAAAASGSEKTSAEQKPKAQGSDDLPIVVGEVAKKSKIRARYKILGS